VTEEISKLYPEKKGKDRPTSRSGKNDDDNIRVLSKRDIFKHGNYPYKKMIGRVEYEDKKQELQIELLKMQNWVKETGQRIVILFEGIPP